MCVQDTLRRRGTLCVAGVAITSVVWFLYNRRHRWWKRKPEDFVAEIHVVNSLESWASVQDEFSRDVADSPIVGFDAEWTRQTPISLVQICARNGTCYLFRVNQFALPIECVEVLISSATLKVGCGIKEDARRLLAHLGVNMRGVVDLGKFLRRQRISCPSYGLKPIAEQLLNVDPGDYAATQCSDWDTTPLSHVQLLYAASDAAYGMRIFYAALGYDSSHVYSSSHLRSFCQGLIDSTTADGPAPGDALQRAITKSKAVELYSECSTLSRLPVLTQPLYENCRLRAADGQDLCIMGRKKALWYISKGLGEMVSKDPFIVQLNFEPTGRPGLNDYHMMEKHNRCVVCGQEESLLRKSIIPHEYRRYFPAVMSDHSCHDIVLMCKSCHYVASHHDNVLRVQFSRTCAAPIDTPDAKYSVDQKAAKVKALAKALQRSVKHIPDSRRMEIEGLISDYFDSTEFTEELQAKALKLESKHPNYDFVPHGFKVTKWHFDRKQLLEFEVKWRMVFLETMTPRFLPDGWSVSYTTQRFAERFPGQDPNVLLQGSCDHFETFVWDFSRTSVKCNEEPFLAVSV